MPIIKVAQHKPEHMTQLALRNRFTAEEKVAIEVAAENSPAIRVYLADQKASTFIDRYDPKLIEGLLTLEGAGLIAEGRADEIQSEPLQDHERYSG